MIATHKTQANLLFFFEKKKGYPTLSTSIVINLRSAINGVVVIPSVFEFLEIKSDNDALVICVCFVCFYFFYFCFCHTTKLQLSHLQIHIAFL